MRLASKSASRIIVNVDAGFVTFRARTRNRSNGFEPRRSRQSSFAAPAENEDCRAGSESEGVLRAPRISAANYLSRQSGMTADDPASHHGVFLRLYSPNRVETARFSGTPKHFAPTPIQRNQSGVAILRNASGDLSESQRRFRRGGGSPSALAGTRNDLARLFCCVGSPRVPPAAFTPGLAPEDFRRSSPILSVGRFFVGWSAGAPVALLPHIDVALLDPFARQPDIARMRTRPPMAGHPNPLAAPVPLAGNEIPKRRGARRRGNNFFPVRRWWLGGLSDVGAVRRSDLRRNGNGMFDHATR